MSSWSRYMYNVYRRAEIHKYMVIVKWRRCHQITCLSCLVLIRYLLFDYCVWFIAKSNRHVIIFALILLFAWIVQNLVSGSSKSPNNGLPDLKTRSKSLKSNNQNITLNMSNIRFCICTNFLANITANSCIKSNLCIVVFTAES